jgi:hypothetical protein
MIASGKNIEASHIWPRFRVNSVVSFSSSFTSDRPVLKPDRLDTASRPERRWTEAIEYFKSAAVPYSGGAMVTQVP